MEARMWKEMRVCGVKIGFKRAEKLLAIANGTIAPKIGTIVT